MCGRYFIDERTWSEVLEDFPQLKSLYMDSAVSADPHPSGNPHVSVNPRPSGDVFPSMQARALTAGRSLAVSSLSWGFPGFDGKKQIINARAEGIFDKKMFADSIRNKRCVLPAAGFYEWDRAKQKVTFTQSDAPVIYLGGIWRQYGEDSRFVIITREANESMSPVHDRMPLMIRPDAVEEWLFDPSRTEHFLTQPLPQLKAQRGYEQMSLFD